jgi:hypothetical protein
MIPLSQPIVRSLTGLGTRLRSVLTGLPFQPAPIAAPKPERPYLARKRRLPNTFTAQDKRRALEYWGHRCAVCQRPAGLWHTIAVDHWIPLASPDCPGTVRTNMVPLCHGTDGCNNRKYAKMPSVWLREFLSKKQAARKLEEIEYFFHWMENPQIEYAACPYCDKPIYYSQEDDAWQCNYCNSTGDFVIDYGNN